MIWFKNLKVRSKLLLAFVLVILLAAGAGVFILTKMIEIDDEYSSVMEITSHRIEHIFAAKDQISKVRIILHETVYPENTRDDLDRLSAELEKGLDSLHRELSDLHDIAAPAVQERVSTILPQIETYRKDAKEAIGFLLAVDVISFDNPAYRDAMLQSEQKAVNMGVLYADDMAYAIDSLSGMAINVLNGPLTRREQKQTGINISQLDYSRSSHWYLSAYPSTSPASSASH